MTQHSKKNRELDALKDQFEELMRRDPAPNIEEVFDKQIRYRFGETIYRAIIASSKNEDNG